jgi:hypothetical protein
MDALFRIVTERATLTWGRGRGGERVPLTGSAPLPGSLLLRARRSGLTFLPGTKRLGVPEAVADDPEQTVGPRLHEETDYRVFVRAEGGRRASLQHRDPLLTRDLSEEQQGSIVHGYINFRGQVGRSAFSVLVDGEPEFDFEVEVFPTKLDYASDYQQLLADIQDVLTALVMEYLRSTYQLGTMWQAPQPTQLEWLVLVRHVIGTLDQALQHVAQHPIRNLTREPVITRAERVKRVDSSVRAAVRRGRGAGGWLGLPGGTKARERLEERRSRPTLNTPEHQWLAAQLGCISRRLGRLRQEEAARKVNARQERTLAELSVLEATIGRLRRLEPLSSAEGEPPAGFASLQLLGAPGYREAYQACLVLSLGLRIAGGPLALSVKDLSLLYEYWCYIALLRLIAEETGCEIPAETLFSIRQDGVQVMLRKGRQTTAAFDAQGGRKVSLTYNPLFANEEMLIPQQPDMMLTIEERGWPALRLLLDAKYRVEASREYQGRYGAPGPPEDALNVLYRYRDAILERHPGSPAPPRHTIIEAAALFPLGDTAVDDYRQSRLWQSLERIGVGAIPLLPDNREYLREWLRAALRQGGWSLADRVVEHQARERAQDWRAAAAEPVLLGVLREGEEAAHLSWVTEHRRYYMPLLKTQKRQYATRFVALYSPAAIRNPGAITHFARVEGLEVLRRSEIATPWSPRGSGEHLYVLYHLGDIRQRTPPIENRDTEGRGVRFSRARWTSRLALERATLLPELFLETEPEWRLYEQLTARSVPFTLLPQPARLVDREDPTGRVWFVLDRCRVRYTGASGFQIRLPTGSDEFAPRGDEVIRYVLQGVPSA